MSHLSGEGPANERVEMRRARDGDLRRLLHLPLASREEEPQRGAGRRKKPRPVGQSDASRAQALDGVGVGRQVRPRPDIPMSKVLREAEVIARFADASLRDESLRGGSPRLTCAPSGRRQAMLIDPEAAQECDVERQVDVIRTRRQRRARERRPRGLPAPRCFSNALIVIRQTHGLHAEGNIRAWPRPIGSCGNGSRSA